MRFKPRKRTQDIHGASRLVAFLRFSNDKATMNAQTEQQRIEMISGVLTSLESLAGTKWESMFGDDIPEKWHPTVVLNAVKECVDDFELMVNVLGRDRLTQLSLADAQMLSNTIQKIHISLSHLDGFRAHVAGNHSGGFHESYNAFTNKILPTLGELAGERMNLQMLRLRTFEPQMSTSRATLEEIASEHFALRAKLEKSQTDADTLLQSLRETQLLVGVSKQSKAFRDAEKVFAGDARAWLKAAACAVSLLVGAVLVLNCIAGPPRPDAGWTVAANLRYFAGHALLISCISFVAVVFLRNYRAAKHNEIMNAHRARALSTFEEFRSGPEGTASDIVLIQASSAIFGTQSSGFAETDTTGSTHLQELAAAIGVKKS